MTETITKRTHCKHGHEFTEKNTYSYIQDGKPVRHCKACTRIRNEKYRKENAEQARIYHKAYRAQNLERLKEYSRKYNRMYQAL